MTGRPEVLFPLFAGLSSLKGIGPTIADHFARSGLMTPRDLLFTLPANVIDRRIRPSVRDVPLPETLSVEVTVEGHQPPTRMGLPYRVTVRDANTSFRVVFFRAREAWIRQTLPLGERRVLSGRVELYDGGPQMAHPDHILLPSEAASLPTFEPVYPLTAGVTQRIFARAINEILNDVPDLPEWQDPHLRVREGWPSWRNSILSAHRPRSAADLLKESPARRRLAYDELFAHQLTLALARQWQRRQKGRSVRGDGHMVRAMLAALPYGLTGAQN